MTDSLIVEFLQNAGCSSRQAAAFERWIEDTRPVGVGVRELERAIRRTVIRQTTTLAATLATMEIALERAERDHEKLREHVSERLFQ